MQIAQLMVSSAIALVIASVGLYIGNNYRMQTRIKLLELRVHAYRSLFELTEVASPTRLGREESLTEEEQRTLGRAIYDWFYRDGNGLLMPNSTRVHLQALQQKLQGEPLRRQSDDPLMLEVSHFRALLRQDIGVFGSEEHGGDWPMQNRFARRFGAVRRRRVVDREK